ncbi:carboxymuconolactone decarboxylase family protein [Natrinema sp. HArc-T2]|uniref:carboxymuconolactone decarboxylase family protein n=1 Tax=Natrinema sp. HArc-T2 TaxID=3242701 RepID=UPI00359EB7B0
MTDTGDVSAEFQKKTFTIRSLSIGIARFVHNIPRLVRAKRADRVSDQFAEKIMLAVTAVNECQYCTRYHTDLARETGMDQETITKLLESDIGSAVDDDEQPALVFAQQYAETDENPGRDARNALRETYGRETAADVLAFVRAIYFGNLLGNSYDAVRLALARRVHAGRQCLRSASTRISRVVERLRERCPV